MERQETLNLLTEILEAIQHFENRIQIRFENKNNVPGEKISEVNLLDSMYEDQAHRTFYASNL